MERDETKKKQFCDFMSSLPLHDENNKLHACLRWILMDLMETGKIKVHPKNKEDDLYSAIRMQVSRLWCIF